MSIVVRYKGNEVSKSKKERTADLHPVKGSGGGLFSKFSLPRFSLPSFSLPSFGKKSPDQEVGEKTSTATFIREKVSVVSVEGRRVLASMVDFLLVMAFFLSVDYLIRNFVLPTPPQWGKARGLTLIILLACWYLYFVEFTVRNGQTFGKKLFNLRIICHLRSGIAQRVSLFLREGILKWVSLALFPILLYSLIFSNRPTLHDLAAKTVVEEDIG